MPRTNYKYATTEKLAVILIVRPAAQADSLQGAGHRYTPIDLDNDGLTKTDPLMKRQMEVIDFYGGPNGIRTRVTDVRGRCPSR